MVHFWIWGVRNPALLLATMGLLAGLGAVAEWPLALMAATTAALVAAAAHRLARNARNRSRRAQAMLETERAIREIREHCREQRAGHRDAA